MWWAATGGIARSPQVVTIGAGRIKPVAMGRAQIWFGAPGEDMDIKGSLQDTAQIEVICKGDRQEMTVSRVLSEPVCGVRLRLIELLQAGVTGAYPMAQIEVSWG